MAGVSLTQVSVQLLLSYPVAPTYHPEGHWLRSGGRLEYLDSTVRLNSNALGHWLAQEIPSEQAYLRIKTGYFTLNGLGGLKASIDHLVQNDLPISIALGANEKATIKADVDALYSLMGCPRANAKLCVISCVGGLFHPKVIHLTRTDGTQLAYVGSANVTPAGLNGTNIEAGILIDSRKGDPASILTEIAASIDDWFHGAKVGVTNIAGAATTQQLVATGILGVVRQITSNSSAGSAGGQPAQKMPLAPLVSFPKLGATGHSNLGGATGHSNPASAAGSAQGSTTALTPGFGSQEILIAEIGKGVRWKQANFPYVIMQSYFGVNPTGSGYIDLIPIDTNGSASPPVTTQVVSVQSKNYRLELGSVSGTSYPATGRPIAVFRKTGAGQFRYRVFFPGDQGHAALSGGLSQLYQGPTRQLPRLVVDSATLASIWPACPV